MSLDLSPRPGAAPLPRMLGTQTLMELRLLARNGEQLLLTLAIPLLLIVMGTRSDDIVDLGAGRPVDILTPGVLALAVLSTSFTSVAIATGFERRYGVLKRLGASPLPRWGLLVGKVAAVAVVELVQLAVLSAVALAVGWEPHGVGSFGWLVLYAVVATWSFGAWGLFLAGALRAEATLAVANLVYVLLLVGGGLVVPLSRYPEAAARVLELLPSGALGEALREAFAGANPAPLHLAVLAAWAVVGTVLTARTFRWE